MNRNTIFQIQAAKLKEINPHAWEECMVLVNPPITDLDLLPAVLNEVIKYYEVKPDNYTKILSIVYYLFAPYKLYSSDIKMRTGIRAAVCKVIGWNHSTSVNDTGSRVVAYWKGARFREEIMGVAEEIKKGIGIYSNQEN